MAKLTTDNVRAEAGALERARKALMDTYDASGAPTDATPAAWEAYRDAANRAEGVHTLAGRAVGKAVGLICYDAARYGDAARRQRQLEWAEWDAVERTLRDYLLRARATIQAFDDGEENAA